VIAQKWRQHVEGSTEADDVSASSKEDTSVLEKVVW
jgi:hypothetical protein